jgi:hypothetical protein
MYLARYCERLMDLNWQMDWYFLMLTERLNERYWEM